MGVDCEIHLPDDVQIRDVADVLGILAGNKKEWRESKGARWVGVENVSISGNTFPGLACITLPYCATKRDEIYVLYHFEPGCGGRLLMPRSTAWWIAAGKRLVDFFGGSIDFNDCDDSDVDYERPKPRGRNNPENGEPWRAFQEALFAVEPLTQEEVDACAKHSAY